jgi:RNA polymerase sigma-70 factor (ECF subfamily)
MSGDPWPAQTLADRSIPPARVDRTPSDRKKIDGLYRSHAGALRRFIRARIRSEADAEDVLHEVFVRICRLGELDSLRSPAAVLFKTAFRLTLNAIRRRRNCPLDASCELGTIADGALSPEDELIMRREFAAIMRTFAALPPQCRKVLALRTMDGLSYEEMSGQLGLSVSTLEKHVVKGRRILRQRQAGLNVERD